MSIFDDLFKKYVNFLSKEKKTSKKSDNKKLVAPKVKKNYEYQAKNNLDIIKDSYNKKLNTLKNIDNLKDILQNIPILVHVIEHCHILFS